MDKIMAYFYDIIIAIVIIFLSVFIYFGLRTETVIKLLMTNTTDTFLSNIEKNGYFTIDDYEGFMERISLSNALYDITFEHKHKVYEPEYRMRTLQEILDAQNAAYTGTNVYTYRNVTTTIPVVNDPVSTGSMNTETNESVLVAAVNTPASPDHVHTSDCYKTDVGPYALIEHKHTLETCIQWTPYRWEMVTCSNCGYVYCRYYVSYGLSTSNTQYVASSGYNDTSCSKCGSTSYGNSRTLYDYSYICGYVTDINGDGLNDAVGYDNTYTYKMTNPPADTIVKTNYTIVKKTNYTNGFYSYHIHGVLPYYNEGTISCYKNQYYPLASGYDQVSNIYLGGVPTNFCYIPLYYQMIVHSTVTGTDTVYFTFKAEQQSDGTILFKFTDCSSNVVYNHIPTYITIDDLYLLTSSSGYATFYGKYIGTFMGNTSNLAMYGYYSGEIDLCTQTEKTWYTTGGTDSGTYCDQVVTSISPTHPVQTVAVGDSLITTVVATYLDGSTKTIICTASGYDCSLLGNQTVILTYNGLIDNAKTTGTKTCTITVTVIPRTKTCSNGHVYNINSDGSDPGCPYCKAWLKSIQFIYPTTSLMTITIGTTLQDNGVKLLATYMDGSTEIVNSGYEDNLDTEYYGTMQVTVGYKGLALQLQVTAVCKKIKCEICGNYYDLYPDSSDPGCPYCIQKIPVFTGNVLEYEKTEYTGKILESLYQNDIYHFDKGDMFTISLKNKSNTMARNLLSKYFPSLSEEWFNMTRKGKINTN